MAQWERIRLPVQETQETQVWYLGQEDLLQEMATHSSILAWKIPWSEEPRRLWSMVLQRVRHNWAHTHTVTWHCGLSYIVVLLLSCVQLCSSMDIRLTFLHYLWELAQTHDRRVDDAVLPSHSLLPPSPPALNLSQHQCLFQWVSSSDQVAKV